MRKEMVIRIHMSSEKGHSKAIKVAAAVNGVESVTIGGENKNLLLVIGVGIDSNHITEKLRRKVGHAEVVELHTVDADAEELAGDHPYRYHPSPSPYTHVAARDLYCKGAGRYPQATVGARDNYYTAGSYAPTMGAWDYYNYGGSGGGGYPAQYQQHDYFYPPAVAANTHTVVHHEYSNDLPNSCSVI